MAVYQTGSVSGVVALLATLKDFAVANGATLNNYAADGSGQRCHLKLGNGYFNFRALVNETHPGFAGAPNLYGVFGYGSTGYNGGSPWNDQPGGPKYGSTVYPSCGMAALGSIGTPSPTLTYHLVYVDRPNLPRALAITGATNASPIVITSATHRHATGDRVVISGVGGNTAANGTFTVTKLSANTYSLDGSTGNGAYTSGGTATDLAEAIYLVVEYTSGIFQHLFFGTLDKSEAGEVFGGQFVTANVHHTENVLRGPIDMFGRGRGFGSQRAINPASMAYATVDGVTGWKLEPNTLAQPSNANQLVGDTIVRYRNRINCSPNAFNSRTIENPIGVTVTRDGVVNAITTATPWTIIGFLPECYYVNLKNYSPGQAVTIGSTQYRVFPMCQKSDTAFSVFSTLTQYYGFALRVN